MNKLRYELVRDEKGWRLVGPSEGYSRFGKFEIAITVASGLANDAQEQGDQAEVVLRDGELVTPLNLCLSEGRGIGR